MSSGRGSSPRRENHHRPPQTSLDHDRARDGRAHARRTDDGSDLPGQSRIVLDAGGAAGLPNGCNDTRAVQRPARSDRERLAIALAEAADDDRAFRLVADHPHVRDGEDAGDLLGDGGKELIRRGLARDERRDLPQGRLFVDELANVLFRTLEHLDRSGPGVARGDSAEEVRLALTQRLRHGNRPVAQNDFAATLRNVERLRVLRLGACEYAAVAVHEQIRAPRHEIAVATSQPSVLIAPDLRRGAARSSWQRWSPAPDSVDGRPSRGSRGRSVRLSGRTPGRAAERRSRPTRDGVR